MKNLYFQNSRGEYELVVENPPSHGILRIITEDVKKRNPHFKIHYFNVTKGDGRTCYDVGSWSEFYILTDEAL